MSYLSLKICFCVFYQVFSFGFNYSRSQIFITTTTSVTIVFPTLKTPLKANIVDPEIHNAILEANLGLFHILHFQRSGQWGMSLNQCTPFRRSKFPKKHTINKLYTALLFCFLKSLSNYVALKYRVQNKYIYIES